MKKFYLPYCRHCSKRPSPYPNAIEVGNISVNYPGSAAIILKNISFTIKTGERIALLGSNGAGKSTLLKTLAGILHPLTGSIKVFNHSIKDCLHEITYLPQRSEMDWSFPISLFKLVLTGSYIRLGWFKHPPKEEKKRTFEALKLLGLEELGSRQIDHLSVGQQQRALIARALVHNPALFLLDEPYNAVDSQTEAILRKTFNNLNKEGKTLLIATHKQEHLQEDFDSILYINEGNIKNVFT